jgi:hypothetical protein
MDSHEAVTTREEIRGYIGVIPDVKLNTLKPPLSYSADGPFVVETDLTEEEKRVITDGRILYAEHPEDFVSLSDALDETAQI